MENSNKRTAKLYIPESNPKSNDQIHLKYWTYSMEEELQLQDKLYQDYEFYLKTLPSFFRLARIMRTNLRKYLEKSRFTSSNLSLKLGVFVDKNVKQTRKSFRSTFRNSPRKYILLPGSRFITTQVYENTLIQSFFEFSLKYSFILRKPFSVKQLRTIFINFNKIAIGLPFKTTNKKIVEEIHYYQQFVDSGKGFLDTSNLPTGKAGKPKGHRAENTKKRDRLKRQGFTDTEIILMEFPHLSPKEKRELTKRERDLFTSKKETVRKSSYRSRKNERDKY